MLTLSGKTSEERVCVDVTLFMANHFSCEPVPIDLKLTYVLLCFKAAS